MKNSVHVSVVGCGYWGPNLIRNFSMLQDSRVQWICDIDEKRLEHMSRLYSNVKTTADFNDLLGDDTDAVVVATPVQLHYAFTKAALEAGKHVFIEKPMASSVKECDELNKLADESDKVIMIGHTFVYTPAVRKIKEIVDSGELGEIYYINSQRLNLGLFQKDINVAWDLAPHDLSIILYILGQMPVSVNCQGKANVHKDIEDITNMSIRFSDGGFATIQSSWLDPNKIRKMTFVGSKKMLVYDDNEPLEKLKIYDKHVELPPYYDSFGEFQFSYHYGDMNAPYIKQTEPLRVETQHFVDCINNGTRPESSGYEGQLVVEILEAANQSLVDGGKQVAI